MRRSTLIAAVLASIVVLGYGHHLSASSTPDTGRNPTGPAGQTGKPGETAK